MGEFTRPGGKNVFRLRAGYFQIQAIRTKLNLITPSQFPQRPNLNLIEKVGIVPQRENSLTG